MAENNSSAPLKTAEGAAHQLLIALRTIAAYPITNLLMNMDAANMQRIAVRALEAQAAPAAVAVSAKKLASLVEELRMLAAVQEPEYPNFQIVIEEAAKVLENATPALPATEDSSAGDLATESVLIEGVAYTIPEPVALELLRLNIELQQAEVQAEPVMKWQNGVGLLWDVHAHGKPSHRVVSPLNWDAHGVYLALVDGHYAKHIDVKLVSAENNNLNPEIEAAPAPQAQPADALDAWKEERRLLIDEAHENKYRARAFEQDAARYRFIRDTPWANSPLGRVIAQHRNALWDTEIDAAMAAAQEGGNAAKEA